jgi:aspartate aminotransferase
MGWLLDAMATAASETYTSTSAPIQYAAVRAFTGGMRIERYLRFSRRVLSALGREVAERLIGAGVRVKPPEGAFYLFPDFSPHAGRLSGMGITTSAQLCERLLADTGVAMLPGSEFGRPSDELTARIAYVDFDGARALSAAEAVPLDKPLDDAFLDAHCGGVIDAIDVIARWLAPS